MAAEWSFVDCGESSDHAPQVKSVLYLNDFEGEPTDAVELLSLEVSPDPPVPGKDLTIKVKGIAHTRIEEGAYADVVVKLGLIKLLTKQFDVCKEAAKANASVTCPVEEGEYEVTHTVQLPREIPPAKFVVSVRGYTADEDTMLCLDLNADFRPML
ncbi:ML domain-containing protein [Mycena leptocephala]|nr:ML domain-containing protein [Mycena leptocephala]